MEMEEVKDYKEDIDIKDEPPGYDLNSSLESEGVNVNRVLKSELKNDVNIKCEPLDCTHNETDSVSVIGSHPTLTSEKFINREVEEDEEEEKIDIKYESLDYGLKKPAIENANEHAEKQFECHKCYYKSKFKSNLRMHILLYHQKEPAPQHACDICSYRSIYKSNLKQHIKRKHTEFGLECTLCEKSFKYKKSLDSHYVSMHWDQSDSFKHLLPNKVSQCSKCSYVTGDVARFKRHLLTHEEDQSKFKFDCHICEYKCVQKSHLKIHVRLHTGQLPFKCIKCNQRFNQKHQLDGHIMSRHKENEELMKTVVTSKIYQEDQNKSEFECYTCGYKFVQKSTLVRHVRIHTGRLPFSCTECNKRFMLKFQLDSHIVSRHKENEELIKIVTSKIHHCLKCSYQTVTSSNFKKHIKYCNNK